MPSYSDAEMRAIVGRALQIDTGRSDRFTPDQLRTIAAELGISTQALEVAMYEADSQGRAVATQPAPSRMSGWAKGAVVAVGALAIIVSAFALMRNGTSQPVAAGEAEQPTAVVEAEQVRPEPTRAVAKKTTTKVQR